jgi:hypothetical protein
LLRDIAANALAPASRNDHCRNDPHRKCPLPFSRPALAHVSTMCEPRRLMPPHNLSGRTAVHTG